MNVWLYHFKEGARIFNDVSQDQVDALVLSGWYDHPGKTSPSTPPPEEDIKSDATIHKKEDFKTWNKARLEKQKKK